MVSRKEAAAAFTAAAKALDVRGKELGDLCFALSKLSGEELEVFPIDGDNEAIVEFMSLGGWPRHGERGWSWAKRLSATCLASQISERYLANARGGASVIVVRMLHPQENLAGQKQAAGGYLETPPGHHASRRAIQQKEGQMVSRKEAAAAFTAAAKALDVRGKELGDLCFALSKLSGEELEVFPIDGDNEAIVEFMRSVKASAAGLGMGSAAGAGELVVLAQA
ncbi:hypothetical protein VOLCADRAFT_97496 [Volvox carteri f. nagariensis]|uniref:Uncharacterized protein n=1 Tax=Volvox carteri f. nagariensis TaxID=3068 RepID=D8UCW4_VOLCA|nr:uncharacterized protein VOLCADRAFT_97496 [Volvox carteri f. nagariensis]EFJ42461.1 hypothetical protein VOLCADRAFT_97496 [Volvox carteri f. nagariensis]|eukprot:XP_002956524.1 hypothetical protein VOLCADRAFT_97496 [Volvox carteri f. nagariensis]